MKLTQRVDIENWLNTHHHMPENYTIDENLVVSITGDVSFEKKGLSEFPFVIERIEGNFNCSHNQLETLVGGPRIVTKKYNCSHNRLSDMKGMAKQVSHINCSNNQIRSLCDFPDVSGITAVNNLLVSTQGCPKNVTSLHLACNQISELVDLPIYLDTLILQKNLLKTLHGAPRCVGVFNCANNPLKTLEFSPLVERSYLCHDCELEDIQDIRCEDDILLFAHNNHIESFVLNHRVRELIIRHARQS